MKCPHRDLCHRVITHAIKDVLEATALPSALCEGVL